MGVRISRAILAAVCLIILSFLVFFCLQAIAYQAHIFSYLGLNLFFLSVVISFCLAFFGPFFIKIFIDDYYERRLISILTAIAFLGHINVYNIVFPISLERSFSVRILVNLAEAPNSLLTKSEIEKLQPKERIYGLRYREMSGSGLIVIDGEKVTLTERGHAIARIYVALADIIGYSKGFGCVAMEDCVGQK